MPLHVRDQREVGLAAHLSPDLQHLFARGAVSANGVLLPRPWYILPDIRPSVVEEGLDLLQGRLPARLGGGTFDAVAGPFSSPASRGQGWIVSFDFLRDLSPSYGDLVPILELWLRQWFQHHTEEQISSLARWIPMGSASNRSDIMVWRARRVINWLSHLLPIAPSFSHSLQRKIGDHLLADIARLLEPERRLWDSIVTAWEPLSRRARWTRAVGVLAVESAAPGLVQPSACRDALEVMNELVAADGMFADGSPIGTLSAAADLAMLRRVTATEPLRQRMRQALVTLRRSDGVLVTFSKLRGFSGLLEEVLGPEEGRRSTILKTGHIGMLEAGPTRIWMRAPSGASDTGPICEIESHGVELLGSSPNGTSALTFGAKQTMIDPQIRRRDEAEKSQLEAKISFDLDGQRHSCIRTMTLSHDGRHVTGEDALFAGSTGTQSSRPQLVFDLGLGSHVAPSRDGESLLIRSSAQHAWRFRSTSESADVRIVELPPDSDLTQIRRLQLICAPSGGSFHRDLILSWDMKLEELL